MNIVAAYKKFIRSQPVARDPAEGTRLLKACLMKYPEAKRIDPLPQMVFGRDPIRTFYFYRSISSNRYSWEEYDAQARLLSKDIDKNSQMMVSASPQKLGIEVTTCALITLYDTKRRAGAAMHVHEIRGENYKRFIVAALYAMGGLRANNLSNTVANIFGIKTIPGYERFQNNWVNSIRQFLEDFSVRVERVEVGRPIKMRIDLSDGSLTECPL